MWKKIRTLPRAYRLSFLAFSFTLALLLFGAEALRYIGGWTLLLFVLFPETLSNKPLADKTKDMLRLLARHDDRLRVGMEQAALSAVKKVAIDEYDEHYAIISFPYTNKITANYLFPREQIAEVRAWFQQHTPELELVK